MLSSSPGGDIAPPPERIPNFLLSSGTSTAVTASPSNFPYNPSSRTPTANRPSTPNDPATTPSWPFPARRHPSPHVTFNDRLRSAEKPDRLAGSMGPGAGPGNAPFGSREPPLGSSPSPSRGGGGGSGGSGVPMRTPSRMPPSRSLLDSGPPTVVTLRSPAASPAAGGGTPASRALRTPGSASPAAGPGAERWVTVFGFSPSMESQVLREFRRHGEVVRTVAGRGNWVHVLYRTPLQAQVALYKPWRILSGTETMVGAVPCTEPQVAREADEQIERGVMVASPSTPHGWGGMKTPPPAHSALRTPASMLRRDAGVGAGGGQNLVRTPQRQPGILDYISGFYK